MKKKHIRLIVMTLCVLTVLFAAVPTAMAATPTMSLGTSSSNVTQLQNRLISLGYSDFTTSTGYYGALTKTAVIRFQRSNGLGADGVAGPLTQSKLYSSTAKSYVLKEGSNGEGVQTLQLKLKALGYFTGTGTGYYGPVTRNAVIAFQKANGLSADGIAGPATRNKAFGSAVSASSQSPASLTTAAIADIGLAQMGKSYVLGGNGPDTYDCSGLAYYAMTKAGFSVQRYSASAYSEVSSWTKITTTASLQKGDLVFFKSDTSSYISHMGIYTGGGQFVHASSGQGKVMVSSIDNAYWARNFVLARRVA
jgi:peptidoglycan hydrolase-like protein with peptidoglycan-binding domain